jgi:hypothetical protein
MKDYHKPGYWKDWYWNKGGREKVQYSKKVTQVLKKYDTERKNRQSHSDGIPNEECGI